MDSEITLLLLLLSENSLGYEVQFQTTAGYAIDTDRLLSSHSDISATGCVYLCARSDGCHTFTYDYLTRKCQLREGSPTLFVPGFPSPTASAFVATRVTTFTTVDCDFETGLCCWTQSKDDDFDWKLHSGPTPSPSTGPSYDNTKKTGEGWFLYGDASESNNKDCASLVSIELMPDEPVCLSFYYQLYGADVDRLNLYVLDNKRSHQLIWAIVGDQGNHWRNARINILVQSTSYRLVLAAFTGAGVKGDIAVDDITLKFSAC